MVSVSVLPTLNGLIMDYLFEEVLRRQPPEIREFPLKTLELENREQTVCN
jgi:ATP/maltotriose-dependent transcriptional regulator MalT